MTASYCVSTARPRGGKTIRLRMRSFPRQSKITLRNERVIRSWVDFAKLWAISHPGCHAPSLAFQYTGSVGNSLIT